MLKQNTAIIDVSPKILTRHNFLGELLKAKDNFKDASLFRFFLKNSELYPYNRSSNQYIALIKKTKYSEIFYVIDTHFPEFGGRYLYANYDIVNPPCDFILSLPHIKEIDDFQVNGAFAKIFGMRYATGGGIKLENGKIKAYDNKQDTVKPRAHELVQRKLTALIQEMLPQLVKFCKESGLGTLVEHLTGTSIALARLTGSSDIFDIFNHKPPAKKFEGINKKLAKLADMLSGLVPEFVEQKQINALKKLQVHVAKGDLEAITVETRKIVEKFEASSVTKPHAEIIKELYGEIIKELLQQ